MTNRQSVKLDRWNAREVLADFVRIYLKNLRELKTLREDVKAWSTLFEIGKTLASILELSPLLNKIVDFAIEITGAERGFILLARGETDFIFRTARDVAGHDLDKSTVQISRSIARRVLRDGHTIAIDNLREASSFAGKKSIIRLGLHSVLCVPLLFKGRILGAIYVDSRRESAPFGRNHREMLEALATQAAIAIENSRLYEELERRTAEREKIRRLAALGSMSAGIAHEIRNPLCIISNAAYFLKSTEESDDGERREQYDILFQEISRANRIIDDLLKYTRIRPPAKQKIVLEDLIRETVRRVVAAGTMPEHTIRLKPAPCPVEILLDPDQIQQVLINIIDNAAHVMDGGGTITIAWNRDKNKVNIRISDTGPGIPEDALPRLFEPFFSKRRNGTGLGLAIAQSIVHLHDGSITAENAPEGGATFSIQLPVSA